MEISIACPLGRLCVRATYFLFLFICFVSLLRSCPGKWLACGAKKAARSLIIARPSIRREGVSKRAVYDITLATSSQRAKFVAIPLTEGMATVPTSTASPMSAEQAHQLL